jgi:hypothetical protein
MFCNKYERSKNFAVLNVPIDIFYQLETTF